MGGWEAVVVGERLRFLSVSGVFLMVFKVILPLLSTVLHRF